MQAIVPEGNRVCKTSKTNPKRTGVRERFVLRSKSKCLAQQVFSNSPCLPFGQPPPLINAGGKEFQLIKLRFDGCRL